jgi:ABC-2 type transport system ATP-binding protein
MEEVQTLCERVAIIDHGRVLACDGIPQLLEGLASDLLIHVEGDGTGLGCVKGLALVETGEDGTHVLVVSGAGRDMGDRVREILNQLLSARIRVVRVETPQTNLERLFLKLTGYGLRD